MKKLRVLSGMRPTGKIHLGNYWGALSNWVKLQEEYECFYFIADLHALTTGWEDTSQIKGNIEEMLIDWLACGIDTEKSTIFLQSALPPHSEFFTLLSMITPVSWLERCPTYKEYLRQTQNQEIINYGFLGYPVLQTADILLYKAEKVPVGEDQLPHLELSREIARRFNNLYKNIFPEPEALLTPSPKITGTDGRKMSKSYNNCIYISDPPDTISKKIQIMITDPARIHPKDKGHPDVCSVYALHKLYHPDVKILTENCKKGEIGCVQCKKDLNKYIVSELKPFQEKREKLLKDDKKILDILNNGSQKALKIANKTLQEVKEVMNLCPMK